MRLRHIGFALAAGGGLLGLCSCGEAGRGPRAEQAEPAARAVQVATAVLRPMPLKISVTGTLAAQENSMLSAKVPGRLEQLRVDIGSTVRKGDLLAQIERRDYELQLQQAEAALSQARTALGLTAQGDDDTVDLARVTAVKQARAVLEEAASNRERVLNLAKSGIASQSEVDTVEATHTVALARYENAMDEARTRMATLAQRRAELDLASKRLSDTSVAAPFDGAVQARPANLGEYVVAGAPIVQLVRTDPLRLRLRVPEREAPLVRLDQEVRLAVENDTNIYSGRIVRLSPALNEQTRMLIVEADVPAHGTLRAGFFARADIIVNPNDSGLSVPPGAVTVFAGVEKVITIRNGKAFEQPITTGRKGEGWVEVVSGLEADEQVVLNPAGLRTGQPVTVAPSGAGASAEQQTGVVPAPEPPRA